MWKVPLSLVFRKCLNQELHWAEKKKIKVSVGMVLQVSGIENTISIDTNSMSLKAYRTPNDIRILLFVLRGFLPGMFAFTYLIGQCSVLTGWCCLLLKQQLSRVRLFCKRTPRYSCRISLKYTWKTGACSFGVEECEIKTSESPRATKVEGRWFSPFMFQEHEKSSMIFGSWWL